MVRRNFVIGPYVIIEKFTSVDTLHGPLRGHQLGQGVDKGLVSATMSSWRNGIDMSLYTVVATNIANGSYHNFESVHVLYTRSSRVGT